MRWRPVVVPSCVSAVEAGRAVGLFPEDVGVTGVAGGFLDEVYVDPAQRHPTEAGHGYRIVEGEAGGHLPGLLACPLVVGDEFVDGFVLADAPPVVGDVYPDLAGRTLIED